MNEIITVQDIINELNNIEDKTKPIYVNILNDIFTISMVDTGISDRIDLNVNFEQPSIKCGRKIEKMFHVLKREIDEDIFNFLVKNDVIYQDLDYMELSSYELKKFVENFDDYDKQLNNGNELTLQQIFDGIGNDIVEYLLNGLVDFVEIQF